MDIKALKQELAEKLRAKDEAIQAAIEADELYTIAFNSWQAKNPEIVAASNIAGVNEQKAKADFQTTRKRIVKELSLHFSERPQDAELEAAFGLRLSAEPVYEGTIEFNRAVVKSGMLFLLKPDEEAITAFVKGMAKKKTFTVTTSAGEDDITTHVMSQKILDCLPALSIKTVTKATISDTKLQD